MPVCPLPKGLKGDQKIHFNNFQAKNTAHRAEIKKASSTGIHLSGQQEKQKLPEQFIQETVILSDILDLNEYVCVELLLTGEQQQPNFPGLTRGLVAVLLYHDGCRCLINALKILLQSREGITWTLGISEDMGRQITMYTEQLINEGMLHTVFRVQTLELCNINTT